MFYILIALICFVFGYALFLDNKCKIEVFYDKESEFVEDGFKYSLKNHSYL